MCNRLDTITACDRRTDRQTDRQTSGDVIVRAIHTRRAVKTVENEITNKWHQAQQTSPCAVLQGAATGRIYFHGPDPVPVQYLKVSWRFPVMLLPNKHSYRNEVTNKVTNKRGRSVTIPRQLYTGRDNNGANFMYFS